MFTAIVALLIATSVITLPQAAHADDEASTSAAMNVAIKVNGASGVAGAKLTKTSYQSGDEVVIKWNGTTAGNDIIIPTSITYNAKTYNMSDWFDISKLQVANTAYKKHMGDDVTMMTYDKLASYAKASHSFSLGTQKLGGTLTVNFSRLSPVYRLYNKVTSEHLFSTNKKEYDDFQTDLAAGKDNWIGEGIDWLAPSKNSTSTSSSSTTTVKRLYNAALGAMFRSSHYYTSDESEIKDLTTNYGWVLDDDANFFESGGSVPVYTAYSELLGSAHHYTSSWSEWRGLDAGWDKEDYKNGLARTLDHADGVAKCYIGTNWSYSGNYYKVRHYLNNKLTDTQYVAGTAGRKTAAKASSYPGYKQSGTITQKTIAKDNSTVVDIYYTAEAPTANYSIQVYDMGTDGNYPSQPTQTLTGNGKIGGSTNYAKYNKLSEGFYVDTAKTKNATINKNGKTTVKVYNARNKVTVKFVSNAKSSEAEKDGDEKVLTTQASVCVGSTVSKPDSSGYTAYGRVFEKWLNGGYYTETDPQTGWNFDSDTVPTTLANGGELKIYAKWKGQDAWISRSKTITTGNTVDTANKENPEYKGSPEAEIIRSGDQIKEDVAVLKDESQKDTEKYKEVMQFYTDMMNNDNYHLYTRWDYTAADKEGTYEENKYLEFRVVNVGTHYNVTKKDGEATDEKTSDGSVLTFQMTHLAPNAFYISNASASERTGTEGWEKSPLRTERIATLGKAYENMLGGLINKNIKVETFKSGSKESTETVETTDSFFLASCYETVSVYGSGTPYEGETYAWYKTINVDGLTADKANPALVKRTRAGHAALGDTTDGQYWTRTPNRNGTTDQCVVGSDGNVWKGNSQGGSAGLRTLEQNQYAGVVICFCF